MICPPELASDLSALRGKECEVGPEVIDAGSAVRGSRSGANDESTGDQAVPVVLLFGWLKDNYTARGAEMGISINKQEPPKFLEDLENDRENCS